MYTKCVRNLRDQDSLNYQWWISFHIALLMLWYLYVENIKTFEIMWTQSSISHITMFSATFSVGLLKPVSHGTPPPMDFLPHPPPPPPPDKIPYGKSSPSIDSPPPPPNRTSHMLSNIGGCRGYFRDPWLALNFLREMWLLLFNPRELWFVDYRDPWFHNYFPRYLWKRPHFLRENDEKFWKLSVFLNNIQRKMRKMLNGDGIFSV